MLRIKLLIRWIVLKQLVALRAKFHFTFLRGPLILQILFTNFQSFGITGRKQVADGLKDTPFSVFWDDLWTLSFLLSFLSSRILWGTHNPRFSFSSVWQNCPIVKINTFKELRTVYLSPRYKPRYDEGLEGLKKYIRCKVVSLYRSYFPYILLLLGLGILFVKHIEVRFLNSAGSSIRLTLFVHIKHRENKDFTVLVMSLITNLRGYLVKSLVLCINLAILLQNFA